MLSSAVVLGRAALPQPGVVLPVPVQVAVLIPGTPSRVCPQAGELSED